MAVETWSMLLLPDPMPYPPAAVLPPQTRLSDAQRPGHRVRKKETPQGAHELRNELVEELTPTLADETCAELDAPLLRDGKNRGVKG